MKKIRSILLCVLCTVVVAGCHQNSPTQSCGCEGKLTGRITPFDIDNDSLPALKSAIEVWLEGTKYRTTTDVKGNWTLNNIPAGIYSIRFTRPGFDTGYFDGYRFSGSGIGFVDDGMILKRPTDTVTLDRLEVVDSVIGATNHQFLKYWGHTSSSQSQTYLCYSAVSPDTGFGVFGGSRGPLFAGDFAIGTEPVKNGQFSGMLSWVANKACQQIDVKSGMTIRFKVRLGSDWDWASGGGRSYANQLTENLQHRFSNELSITVR